MAHSAPRTGFYSGSFDPVTLGHTDVIARAAELVDRLVIGIGVHPAKAPMFSDDERVALLKAECEPIADKAGIEIEIVTFSNLVVRRRARTGPTSFFVVFATARTSTTKCRWPA